MPQNIDSTTKTIGLWLLAHKDEKHITTFEVTQEFPNVAKSRVSNVLTRFCREGYLLRVSRGFYRVDKNSCAEFEQRLRPSAKDIEIVPAINPGSVAINIHLKKHTLNLNTLLVVGVTDLDAPDFVKMLDFLDEYSKTLVGIIKFARSNMDSFSVDPEQVNEQSITIAKSFLKEFLA